MSLPISLLPVWRCHIHRDSSPRLGPPALPHLACARDSACRLTCIPCRPGGCQLRSCWHCRSAHFVPSCLPFLSRVVPLALLTSYTSVGFYFLLVVIGRPIHGHCGSTSWLSVPPSCLRPSSVVISSSAIVSSPLPPCTVFAHVDYCPAMASAWRLSARLSVTLLVSLFFPQHLASARAFPACVLPWYPARFSSPASPPSLP